MILLLVGIMVGSLATAWVIGWLLSSSNARPESRDAVAAKSTTTTTGPTYWHGTTGD